MLVALVAAPVSAQARGATVSGRVSDPSGQPIAQATVSIVELNRATMTDQSGSFQFGTVPAGRYNISARRLGYAPAASTITVGDAPSVVTLRLGSGAQQIEP
jgi:iron complex outermembrane receptor protein